MNKTTVVLLAASALGFCPFGRAADAKVDFTKDIAPILEQNCIKCHGPEKQKGKLRLDSKEAAFKGGKDGAVLVAGEPDKSEVYRRITLPKGHDDIMPSEGDPLTKAQTDLIRDWIQQGAVWPDAVVVGKSAAPAPGKAKKEPPLPADFKPSEAETKAIASMAQAGVDVRPIAMNVPWREANLRLQGASVTDATIAPLKDIASLVDLNLANTKITDAGLANLKPLIYLQRLHLELTGITDAGLAQLKGLTNLVYLNLYATPVTDAGLQHLKGLHYLRNLYVWQTKVTEAGAAELKKALPDVEISTGAELVAMLQKQKEEAAKKAEADKKAEAEKKAQAEKKAEAEKAAAEKKADEKKVEAEKKADTEKKAADEKKDEAEKKPEKKAQADKKEDDKK